MGFGLSKYQFITILIFAMLLVSGCKKWKYPDHIIAGEKSGRHIYYSGSLHIEASPIGGGFTNSQQWEVDINDDGEIDCILHYFASVSPGSLYYKVSIETSSTKNSAIVISNSGGNYVDTIPQNTIIDDNMIWHPGDCILIDSYSSGGSGTQYGLWKGMKNKYVGVRAMAGDNTIYGWLRIEIQGGAMKFIDYAGTGN